MAFIECKFKSKYTGGETDIIVILPVANGKELFSGKEIYDFEGKFKTLYLF
ncbi:TPA: esterase family protein, partial [Clostridioides difficile]|nr:esterase family protein [Clostridioides difficile]HDQ2439576.1 esterase family protein [Clostridioides difficile]